MTGIKETLERCDETVGIHGSRLILGLDGFPDRGITRLGQLTTERHLLRFLYVIALEERSVGNHLGHDGAAGLGVAREFYLNDYGPG